MLLSHLLLTKHYQMLSFLMPSYFISSDGLQDLRTQASGVLQEAKMKSLEYQVNTDPAIYREAIRN